MSFYDDASLIMYPSGYKEDKIYSLKPTDGSGDLDFTRASTATRVNSEGLIETSPVNLLEQSETFNFSPWSPVSTTIGANAIAAPNGTSTAESFTSLATSANHVIYQLLTGVSGSYTFSAYVKKVNSRYVYIKLVGDANDWVAAVFDLNNGALTKSQATGWTGLSASSESVGNGWYRLIVSGSGATSVNFNAGIQYTNTGTPIFSSFADATVLGTGSIDYYIWGAQVNIGATAKPYFPTTDRLNVPRIDYTGGGCGKLLLEKQSTNLITYSEQFTDSSWEKISSPTVTPYAGISPDGSNNATLINRNLGGSVNKLISVTSGQSYAFSTFVKKSTLGNAVALVLVGDAFSSNVCVLVYNFDTQIASITAGTATAKAEQYGNGWARITIVAAPSSTNTGIFRIVPSDDNQNSFIWGAQLEASSFPTSYISTLASSVTRLADTASKSGISSLIGQTEGVIFIEANWSGENVNAIFATLSDGTTVNKIQIGYDTTDKLYVFIKQSDIVQALINTVSVSSGILKIAVGYANNDFVIYLNGVLIGTDTSGVVPSTSRIDVGGYFTSGFEAGLINQALLFKTRLTNSELATLTTL